MTELMNNNEFESAVELAFRLDNAAKIAAEKAAEARDRVKELVLEAEGKNYDGGAGRFHVVMYPTRRFSAALAAKKLDAEALESVSSMQVDRKLVDALLSKDFVQRELTTESAPTLKITMV